MAIFSLGKQMTIWKLYSNNALLIIILISYGSVSFSQEKLPEVVLKARKSIYEIKYDKIEESDLEILYKGQSFTFGDSFESVDQKIGGIAKYSGEFNDWHTRIDESYLGDADYKILFENDYFFFNHNKLAYFIIKSDQFTIKLRSPGDNSGFINLKVGKSVKVLIKGFKKSFAEKRTEGDAYRDVFIVNVGDLQADSPIANNLQIMVEKGTDKISMIAFYGY